MMDVIFLFEKRKSTEGGRKFHVDFVLKNLIVMRFGHFKSIIIVCVLRRIQSAAKVKLRKNKRQTI